jgi:hypothetical protein
MGQYKSTSGGCDTIRLVDGGLDEVFRLADVHASAGHDVLLEGLTLSSEQHRSAALAGRHVLHVLCLDTPLDQCVRNLLARRRTGCEHSAAAARMTGMQRREIELTCRGLRACSRVEVLDFDAALLRARQILGIEPARRMRQSRIP